MRGAATMLWPHRTSKTRANLDWISQSCDEVSTPPSMGSTSGTRIWKWRGQPFSSFTRGFVWRQAKMRVGSNPNSIAKRWINSSSCCSVMSCAGDMIQCRTQYCLPNRNASLRQSSRSAILPRRSATSSLSSPSQRCVRVLFRAWPRAAIRFDLMITGRPQGGDGRWCAGSQQRL